MADMDGCPIAEDGNLFHLRKGKVFEVDAPPVPLADTHGHLTAFRTRDAASALARAAIAGVCLLVVPVDPADDVEDVGRFWDFLETAKHEAGQLLAGLKERGIEPPSFSGAYGEVPDLLDNVHVVAGVHPYGSRRLVEDDSVLRRLRALLADERCVGVGEFGLDFGPWSDLGLSVQLEAFEAQLRLAYEYGMPCELHLRDGEGDAATLAHDEALSLLRRVGMGEAGVDLHCFTSGPDIMAPFTELGAHIAFGGAVTFGRSDDIRQAALACPEGLMLSETDCPYMAPHPLRGQEAEPAMVAVTVAFLARMLEEAGQVPQRATYERLWNNACGFFGLKA